MEKEIGKINKNENTDIVLRIDDFGGKKGLTIREFVTSDRYTGFTKSGVRISPENFSKFKEMIDSVNEEDLKESEEELPEGQETLENSSENEETKKSEKNNQETLPDY
jgi:hypothetical protein